VPTDQVTLMVDLDEMPKIIALLEADPWWGNPAAVPAGAYSRYEGPGWAATYYPGSGKLLLQGNQSMPLGKAIAKRGEDEREAFLYRASVLLQGAVGTVLQEVRVVRDDDEWWLQVTSNDGEVKCVKEG